MTIDIRIGNASLIESKTGSYTLIIEHDTHEPYTHGAKPLRNILKTTEEFHARFANETGLQSFFYDEVNGLLRKSKTAIKLNPLHLEMLQNARKIFKIEHSSLTQEQTLYSKILDWYECCIQRALRLGRPAIHWCVPKV